MKKIIVAFFALILSISFMGCTDNSQTTWESSQDSSVSSSVALNDNMQKKIDRLLKENDNLNEKITQINEDKELLKAETFDLLDQVGDMASQIKDLENKHAGIMFADAYFVDHIGWLSNGLQLIRASFSPGPYDNLYTLAPNGTLRQISESSYNSYIDISPDRSKVIMNDFEFECTARVYMYDVKTVKTRQLEIDNLGANQTVSAMKWLDDRYFLFVSQFDHGTVVRGGNVYVYDTQTDEYKAIMVHENSLFQTVDFEVYDEEFVLISSVLYEETWNFTEPKYHIFTFEEMYDLIGKDENIDLSRTKPLFE